MPSDRKKYPPGKNPNSLANLRPPPPPEKGNQRAKKHGGLAKVSRERMTAKKREVYDALAADAPVRDADGSLPAADSAVVGLLAQTLCRLEDVQAWIDEHGVFDTRRENRTTRQNAQRRRKRRRARQDPLRAVAMEDKLTARAHDLLDALGMTPRSRAKLNLDQARSFDLAKEWEEQDRAKRRRGSVEGEARDA